MNNCIRRFKKLPWLSLLQSVALTYLILAITDILIIWGIPKSQALQKMMGILYFPSSELLVLFGVGLGMGALAIYLIEINPSKVFINITSLWVLFLCLVVALFIIYGSILTPVIVSTSSCGSNPTIIGILMGLFWKGRNYWR